METVGIERKNNSFIGKNTSFTVEITSDGWISKLISKDIEISSTKCFHLETDRFIDTEPYINPLSSSVSFEFDTDFGKLNRIYTIKNRSIVVDDILVSEKEADYHYVCHLIFNPIFDYFMVGHNRFDIEKQSNLEAKDLLLVNESKDLYLGFIFKEKMQLNFTNNQDNLVFNLSLDVSLLPLDMFMISYTFSLV